MVGRPVIKDNYLANSVIENSMALRKVNTDMHLGNKMPAENTLNHKYSSAFGMETKKPASANYGLLRNSSDGQN